MDIISLKMLQLPHRHRKPFLVWKPGMMDRPTHIIQLDLVTQHNPVAWTCYCKCWMNNMASLLLI